jgi:hypothetical protein
LIKRAPELAKRNAYLTPVSHFIPRKSAHRSEVGVLFEEKAILFLQNAHRSEVGVSYGGIDELETYRTLSASFVDNENF